MSRFKANPAANAPIIGSIPPTSTRKPDKNTTKRTNIKLVYFSESALLKNHLAIRGTNTKINTENKLKESISLNRKKRFNPPSLFESIRAKIISTAVSVSIVPPTVIATA